MQENFYGIVPVYDLNLFGNLCQLQTTAKQEGKDEDTVKAWFAQAKLAAPVEAGKKLPKAGSPLVNPRVKNMDFLGWSWRHNDEEYFIPARDRSKCPHAVDCLALGRLLEVVKNNGSKEDLATVSKIWLY